MGGRIRGYISSIQLSFIFCWRHLLVLERGEENARPWGCVHGDANARVCSACGIGGGRGAGGGGSPGPQKTWGAWGLATGGLRARMTSGQDIPMETTISSPSDTGRLVRMMSSGLRRKTSPT